MSADEISHHQHLVIGVTTFLEIVAVASFALRLWARRISNASFWWDDCVMGIGLVCIVNSELAALDTQN